MSPLTIIIPTFNRARFLIATVDQLLLQEFQDFELWVIDQSAPEQSEVIAQSLPAWRARREVNYLRLDIPGVANARNEGLSRARGGVIMFLDDDVILLNPDFLGAHLRCYDDPAVGGVTGRTVERINKENSRRPANRITPGGRTLINLLGTERCEIHTLKGANMSVRTEAVRQIGGFDRNYTGTALLEEADFSERIRQNGWRFVFEPAAELFHLSAPAGGVRVARTEDVDYYRFRSTAYFVRKNRGARGVAPFLAVHLLIAAVRTAKTRNPRLPLRLVQAVRDGFRRAKLGSDQLLKPVPQ